MTRREASLVALGLLVGAAVSALLLISVLNTSFPPTWQGEAKTSDNVRVGHVAQPDIQECETLARRFGLSVEEMFEAGFDMSTSIHRVARQAATQSRWDRKSAVEKVRATIFGPSESDLLAIQRDLQETKPSINQVDAVADVLVFCGVLTEK